MNYVTEAGEYLVMIPVHYYTKKLIKLNVAAKTLTFVTETPETALAS